MKTFYILVENKTISLRDEGKLASFSQIFLGFAAKKIESFAFYSTVIEIIAVLRWVRCLYLHIFGCSNINF